MQTKTSISNKSRWHTRQTLLERVKDRNNQEAWEEFSRYYQKFIYNVVRAMNLGHHDAEEIVQEVMLVAWNQLPEFDYDRTKGRFRGWLCKVSGNIVKHYLRTRKKEATLTLATGEKLDIEIFLADLSDSEIEKIIDREWVDYIRNLAWERINSIFDEKTCTVFKLTCENIPTQEIAKKLEISESTVYVHKKRVEDRFRRELIKLKRELG